MKARQMVGGVPRMWGLWVALFALPAVINFAEAQPNKAGELSGLAKASGTVTSPSEFKAAKVYFRNPDKHMLYMVYTNAGKFQAMNMMPGNYEVSAETQLLNSDVQKV